MQNRQYLLFCFFIILKINESYYLIVNNKFVFGHDMKVYKESSAIARFNLNLGTRWRRIGELHAPVAFLRTERPSYIEWEAGWLPLLLWHFGEEKNPFLLPWGSVRDKGLFDHIGNYCLLKTTLPGWYARFIIVTILLNTHNHVLRTASRCGQHPMVVPSFIIRGLKRLQHST